jgi:hypothetical protein
MTRHLAIALAALLSSATAFAETADFEYPDGTAACEPAADLGFTVKTLSVAEDGSRPAVLVELTVLSQVDLASIRINGQRHGATRPDLTFQVVDDHRRLSRRVARKFQHRLELEPGVEHHVIFIIRGEDSAGRAREASTYLRVNFDAEREPEVLEDLLQFRARMEGR